MEQELMTDKQRKMLFASINTLAKKMEIKPTALNEVIRKKLIKLGYIKKSRNELTKEQARKIIDEIDFIISNQ